MNHSPVSSKATSTAERSLKFTKPVKKVHKKEYDY